MYRMVLFTQWKWGRLALGATVLAAFALPLVAALTAGSDTDPRLAQHTIETLALLGPVFPLVAALTALFVAVTAWGADHQGRHVYALSMPVTRSRFVLLRLGAALTLLLVPLVAFWVGALVAASATTLPPGLHTYPNLLALRFALAAIVAFGFFFAIASATARTAGYVLGGLVAVMLVQLLLFALDSKVNLVGWLLQSLLVWPGPFDVFTGRWMLIDV